MNSDFKKRVEEWAVKEYEACGGDEYVSDEAAAFIDGAAYADRYWRERIEATRAKDPASASVKDPDELYNAGRESIRRELLNDEEKR